MHKGERVTGSGSFGAMALVLHNVGIELCIMLEKAITILLFEYHGLNPDILQQ